MLGLSPAQVVVLQKEREHSRALWRGSTLTELHKAEGTQKAVATDAVPETEMRADAQAATTQLAESSNATTEPVSDEAKEPAKAEPDSALLETEGQGDEVSEAVADDADAPQQMQLQLKKPNLCVSSHQKNQRKTLLNKNAGCSRWTFWSVSIGNERTRSRSSSARASVIRFGKCIPTEF